MGFISLLKGKSSRSASAPATRASASHSAAPGSWSSGFGSGLGSPAPSNLNSPPTVSHGSMTEPLLSPPSAAAPSPRTVAAPEQYLRRTPASLPTSPASLAVMSPRGVPAVASQSSIASASLPSAAAGALHSTSSLEDLHAIPPAAASPSAAPRHRVPMAGSPITTTAATTPIATSFSFVAASPRPSLSARPSLPALPSPRPSVDSPHFGVPMSPMSRASSSVEPPQLEDDHGPRYSTDSDVYPRPYRTYVNMMENVPRPLAEARGQVLVPSLPTLAPNVVDPLAAFRPTEPPANIATYYPLDWKLPVTSALRTPLAADLCASKGSLPGYTIDALVDSYEGLLATLNQLVAQAFARAMPVLDPHSGTPAPSQYVYTAVTHGAPVPRGANPSAAHQAAFQSRLATTLLTDLLVAITSPLRVEDHTKLIKKHLPDLKRDLKPPKAPRLFGSSATARSANPLGLSSHLLFVALDHFMSSTSLSSPLMTHLRPVLAQAAAVITNTFHAHAVPPPTADVVDDLLSAFLDWFIRLKREFPNVGLYVPLEDAMPDPAYMIVEGGPSAAYGGAVAFTTGPGIWDASTGQVGFPARVWTKDPMV
ncbi:hypothetical protein AMAG_15664 [Allomyces macrogynus ATCC 38327]|uniref:Uncharacterized protein n=1 Tax=Allomyces macrogynus (strain ATCC 38327) TaxID=578462 RepID=A0A0L0T9N5_ALLM3|nr:hypothetical protein AMAG_15664 [Allomyces macrogynus ATCC 38327]|eukprot:KNE71430.1 hypothetical protein AMAG_15664 [Allomyces macrogynus ATCC 38327]